MDDEVQHRVVTSGEVPGLMAAYRRAVWGADQLCARLIAAGLNPDELTVAAGLGEDGQPAVHVTALPVVAVALAALFADDTGPPPWYLCRGDPDVA